jgi:hypothetical protein
VRRTLTGAPAVAVVLACLAGCGLQERQDAAATTAEDFYAALASGDTAAACELLTPATRHEVETSGEAPCEEALAEEDLPDASTAQQSEVFGGMAQVRLDADTVFVARSGETWFVRAAGCTPRVDLPYDCAVSGG